MGGSENSDKVGHVGGHVLIYWLKSPFGKPGRSFIFVFALLPLSHTHPLAQASREHETVRRVHGFIQGGVFFYRRDIISSVFGW